jgi:hypothetical protein
VIVVDRMLVGGLRFVLDKLASAVAAELDDETVLRERLLQAQMQLELGEIEDQEFREIERTVLARIRELREDGASAGPISFEAGTVASVEAEDVPPLASSSGRRRTGKARK